MTIWAVVSGDEAVPVLLASELLRAAAEELGHALNVKVVCGQHTIVAMRLRPQPGDFALLVGGAEEKAFDTILLTRVSVADVFADARAVIARSIVPYDGPAQRHLRVIAVTSCPTGIAPRSWLPKDSRQARSNLAMISELKPKGPLVLAIR